MKKATLILMLFALLIALCGCGNAVITCSLDKNNIAQMKVELTIPKKSMNEQELENAVDTLASLQRYLQNTGFEAETTETRSNLQLNILKQSEGRTPKEGFEKLMAMMKADNSPFSYVEGGYSQSYFEDIYNLGANVDLTKIVDYDYINSLPESQKNRILDALSTFSGTVVFDLRGETIEHTGSLMDETNSQNLSLEGPVQIKSVMKIENIENIQNYEKLKEEINSLEDEKSNYTLYLVSSLCLAAVSATLVIAIIASKKNKNSAV